MAEEEGKSRDLLSVCLTQIEWHRELGRCHPTKAGSTQSPADLTVERGAEAGKKQNSLHGVGYVGVAHEQLLGNRLQYGGVDCVQIRNGKRIIWSVQGSVLSVQASTMTGR